MGMGVDRRRVWDPANEPGYGPRRSVSIVPVVGALALFGLGMTVICGALGGYVSL
jgi:hypothetical protein